MRKLYKSRYDKKVAGVCGGIGNYMRLDPAFIRLIFIFITCLSFCIFLFVYFVLAIIMPLEPKNSPALECKKFYRTSNDKVVSGLCGGLAKFFKIEPTILRIIWMVLLIFTAVFPLLITYIVAASITPEKRQ